MKATVCSFLCKLPDLERWGGSVCSEKEGISINQFIASVVAEKIAGSMAQDYLGKRAKRANRERFEEALSHMPDVEREECDTL